MFISYLLIFSTNLTSFTKKYCLHLTLVVKYFFINIYIGVQNVDSIKLKENINTEAICNFIKNCCEIGTNIRTFQCTKNNDLLAAVAIKPYSLDNNMLIYSLSKSFTSACIGIAQSEGLLNIDERIVDIFPEKCPEVISENLFKMRIKDCLCMTSGHSSCIFYIIQHESDPIKSFLAHPVDYVPGTTFVYSTAASYICGAVIERRSGIKLVDYLYEKVFIKMGIEKPIWDRCADGSCMGGTGLIISSETATKFGIMLRDNGVFDGKRIVPEEWIRTASSIHSMAPDNGTADWIAGYGYQFWMNAKEGYRGDGAYGQLCMVFPKRNMAFTLLCESINMQKEVDLVYDLLDNIEKFDNNHLAELKKLTENFYAPQKNNSVFESKHFIPEKNIAAINKINLDPIADGILVTLDCDYGTQKIECGNGFYKKNSLLLQNLNPGIWTEHIDDKPIQINVFASYFENKDEISITLRHIDTPHIQVWHFPKGKIGEWSISLNVGTLNEKVSKTSVVIC